MAKTGAPRKPTGLKLVLGNPGRRPLDLEHEPEPPYGAPKCPDHIKGEERKEWNRVCAELASMYVVTKVDRAALEGYCTFYQQFLKAKHELEKGEYTQTNDKDVEIPSPWVKIRQSAHDQMHKFWIEFGLTAASRTRLRVEKPKDKKDSGEKFFGRHAGK